MIAEKRVLVQELQNKILAMQGFKKPEANEPGDLGLGSIEKAFPGGIFPGAVLHEFISYENNDAAATGGFISTLLSRLTNNHGFCFWISAKRILFPPALKLFGLNPDRIIFIDLKNEKDVLWTIEEALKCNAIKAVVGELKELDFAQSRRLQLAAGRSKVTGFIHRYKPRSENTVTCVSRWKIKSVASETEENFPGLGMPRWNVVLDKVRNGKPGQWEIEWTGSELKYINKKVVPFIPLKKVQRYA